MEERKAKMLFNKNGQGNDTTRMTIPVLWAKALNFSKEDRQAKIILDKKNKKIIIEKE